VADPKSSHGGCRIALPTCARGGWSGGEVLDVRNCAVAYGDGARHDAVAVVCSVVAREGGREGRVAVEEE
jgi:hypothetical protein